MSMQIQGFGQLQEELQEFAAECREAASRTDAAVDKGARNTAKLLNSQMKENILRVDAVDSGELLNSVRWTRVESGTYTVGPTADHAVYVEYGTGIYHKDGGSKIEPDQAQALAFEGEGGEQVVVASVEGMRPRPFFRTAVDKAEEEEWLGQNAIEAVEEMFQEVFN